MADYLCDSCGHTFTELVRPDECEECGHHELEKVDREESWGKNPKEALDAFVKVSAVLLAGSIIGGILLGLFGDTSILFVGADILILAGTVYAVSRGWLVGLGLAAVVYLWQVVVGLAVAVLGPLALLSVPSAGILLIGVGAFKLVLGLAGLYYLQAGWTAAR